MRSARSNTKTAWRAVLGTVSAPEVVVGDRGQPREVAATLWPAAEVRRCEWHLGSNLTKALPTSVAHNQADELHGLIKRAFWSQADPTALQVTVAARRARKPQYTTWPTA